MEKKEVVISIGLPIVIKTRKTSIALKRRMAGVKKARKGDFIKRRMILAGKSDGDTSFDAKKRAQDMGVIDKKTQIHDEHYQPLYEIKKGNPVLIADSDRLIELKPNIFDFNRNGLST